MVQTIRFKRENKEYDAVIGVTEGKESRIYIEDVDLHPVYSQKVRRYLISLNVEADRHSALGKIISIRTEWGQGLIGNSGVPISSTETVTVMITNQEDIKAFVEKFAMPILMSMLNGYVRDTMGFNSLPIFNTTNGSVISYTPEQEALPPSNNYSGGFVSLPVEEVTPNEEGITGN